MASPVLAKLRGDKQAIGISPSEVQRQIALSLSIAKRQSDRQQEVAVTEAVQEIVQALGLDTAVEVSANE